MGSVCAVRGKDGAAARAAKSKRNRQEEGGERTGKRERKGGDEEEEEEEEATAMKVLATMWMGRGKRGRRVRCVRKKLETTGTLRSTEQQGGHPPTQSQRRRR